MTGTVFAYDDKTAHPAITDEIVDFYNLHFDKKITAEEKEWLIQGSILEDTEPRYINHFYDPIYQQGWIGEHGGGWLSKDLMQKFSDVFLSSENGVSTLDWVHNQELQEKYKRYQGNRTWEKALYEYVKNKDEKEAFSDLGYILHLLEDMSVPEHTRNDTHPNDSPYENYTTRFTRDNFQIANNLQKQNFQPKKFNSLDEYFEHLANYSNNYFFSKDTVNDGKYDKPKIVKEDNDWGYGRDKNNQEFILVGVETKRIKEGDEYKTKKVYSIKNVEEYNLILKTYWVRLSREAVLAGAGVIDLFFQEAEKAEKDSSLLKPSSESSSAIFSIYGEITKAINFTTSVVKKIKKTASGILDKMTDLWNKYTIGQSATVIQSVSDIPISTETAEAIPPSEELPPRAPQTSFSETISTTSITPTTEMTEPVSTGPAKELDNSNKEKKSTSHGGGGGGGSNETPAPEPEPPVVPPIIPPTPDTTAPVITVLGSNPEVVIKNSVYTDAGATALDDVDGVREVTAISITDVNTAIVGAYSVTYSASDLSGNISTATRTVTVATYKYIPKYSFGKNNDDGKNWQVWSFNGSNVYDWSDTYVDNYLREQFKIQAYTGGLWCSQCLQRGIFNHDPQNGFELADRTISSLENNPQNNMNGVTYDVTIQWDSSGYTYTISHNSIVDSTGHENVVNMNNDLWVGWDGSYNNFQTFISGDWQGIVHNPPLNRTGGSSMVLPPFPVYKNTSASLVPTLSFPNQGSYTVGGINPTRGRTNLTLFTFQIVYTDGNNNTPQNVKLHVTNTTTGDSLSEVVMQKIPAGADILSDGNFANGELYITNDILYDTGDYDYYFTANDSTGNEIRIPENGVLNFGVIPSTYTYIPKYSFGTNNGDDRDWQVWAFNGSNVYDWSDTYVNKYLKEQFKIQTHQGMYCGLCLERGIFNHDPQKGFELVDRMVSSLENNPQNKMDNIIYNVVIQWDSTGYTYIISHDNIVDATGHTNISNVNEDMWVGWDGSYNHFQTFPSGSWYDFATTSPPNRTGGFDMMLQPYQVYDPSQISIDPDSLPEPDPIIEPEPEPEPDVIAPLIIGYTFNGNAGDITINPLINPLTLSLSSSENVNWMSIKIENQDNASIYKIFQSGAGCEDGSSSCTKTWDGLLSSGESLQNGTFRIKVHIKDNANNEFYDYLSPYVITVNTSI